MKIVGQVVVNMMLSANAANLSGIGEPQPGVLFVAQPCCGFVYYAT